MSALSLTYTLTNGTTGDADQVQQDFDDIVAYINADVVRIDGTNPMGADLVLNAADPSTTNSAARKAYVDGCYVRAHGSTSQTFTADTWTTLKFATEDLDAAGAYNLSTGTFTSNRAGVYLVSFTISPSDADNIEWQLRINGDGTTFDGPHANSSLVDTAGSGTSNMHMSAAVYVGNAKTILPQVLAHGGSPTRSIGADLSIAWLHG